MEELNKCYGNCSSLYVQCDAGEMNEFFSTGKDSLPDRVPRTLQGKDVNRMVIFATNEVGLGREQIVSVCQVLDMPVTVHAWAAHDKQLYNQNRNAIKEEFEKNRQELKFVKRMD